MNTDNPISPNPSKSWRGGPPPPQEIDYEIRRYGGTTTAFDSVETQIQTNKPQNSIRDWVITLNRENGRLQIESYYYRNLVAKVLMCLIPLIRFHSSHLCDVVNNYTSDIESATINLKSIMNRGMKSSSHPIIAGAMARGNPSKSRYSDVGMQQVNDKGSVDFSRIQSPLFITSHHNKCRGYGSTQQLVVDLTRENGKLRYQISQDKNLVVKVLIHLVTELTFHSSGLASSIQRFNAEIQISTADWQHRTESHPEKTQITGERVSNSGLGLHDENIQLGNDGLWNDLNNSQFSLTPEGVPNTISDSIIDLKRQIEELQCQYTYYRDLVDYGLARFIPLIQFHSNELRYLVGICDEESW